MYVCPQHTLTCTSTAVNTHEGTQTYTRMVGHVRPQARPEAYTMNTREPTESSQVPLSRGSVLCRHVSVGPSDNLKHTHSVVPSLGYPWMSDVTRS